MNILFFLTPKSEITYVYDEDTLRQVLEKMERHRYSAVPMIRKSDGRYMGTITEGDLLWYIKDHDMVSIKDAEEVRIKNIKRNRHNKPVYANSNMEDLIAKVMNQNFVPVIDDEDCFIGIVTRKDVMRFLVEKCNQAQAVNS